MFDVDGVHVLLRVRCAHVACGAVREEGEDAVALAPRLLLGQLTEVFREHLDGEATCLPTGRLKKEFCWTTFAGLLDDPE